MPTESDRRAAEPLPEIVAELREKVRMETGSGSSVVSVWCGQITTLLDALTAQAAEVERLRAALKPFADRAESLRQTQSKVEGLARVSSMQPVDVEHLICAAAAIRARGA